MYDFLPLHRHSDDGFGAMADAFKEAADRLSASLAQKKFLHAHLPVGYLYRHAVELYLKSLILVIHRSLRLPSGGMPHGSEPEVLVRGEWKHMRTVHDVFALYSHFKSVLDANRTKIEDRTNTDWSLPRELDASIDAINAADAQSTFMRYPTNKCRASDLAKSAMKETSLDEIIQGVSVTQGPAKVFLLTDDEGHVLGVYGLDPDALQQLLGELRNAAELLSGADFGMRAGLTGGF